LHSKKEIPCDQIAVLKKKTKKGVLFLDHADNKESLCNTPSAHAPLLLLLLHISLQAAKPEN
jgi:hypothetical protein